MVSDAVIGACVRNDNRGSYLTSGKVCGFTDDACVPVNPEDSLRYFFAIVLKCSDSVGCVIALIIGRRVWVMV